MWQSAQASRWSGSSEFQWLFFHSSSWFCASTMPKRLSSSGTYCLWQTPQNSGPVVVGQVLIGVSSDQKVGHGLLPARRVLSQVTARRDQHIVGVAPLVDAVDRVADHAGTAFLHAGRREAQVVDVLGPGKQRNWVMAAGAIARLGRLAVGRELLLHGLERRIHGREAMGARLPLGVNLLVATCRTAGLRVAQNRRVDQ
jgi:hypothetical protein